MGNHSSPAPDVDPRELERTKEMWHNFSKLITYSTATTLVILVLMAWFLL
ncbi:MAG TPA: aa3-type cytochrome c oxidase subunit IV [Alphaproteobacteria bacterium]|jgi:hypothetical protein